MTPVDPLRVAAQIAAILEEAGIRYVIGGSLASSIHGEPRLSIDLDIMIEVSEEMVGGLVQRLRPDFYVQTEAVLDAVQRQSAFNIIHLESAMKVDLFVAENDESVQRQLDRRIAVNAAGTSVYVYAPEDILVRKLRWFRLGGELSDLQWRDVLGILRISGERLDQSYLEEAATRFGVLDLLKRAREEAGE
ncbi:MAG TPA: hypothetical protein VNA04_16370 [Thermoanaerobaculia bacterium]|nr:hypothetical protein [Thermoanaerobaculia bacterium]